MRTPEQRRKSRNALLSIFGILSIIPLCFFIDYKIWRSQHPTAPAWSYLLRP